MTTRRRRIQLQRLVKGLIEKPNEDAGVFLSTSNYSNRKLILHFRRCLANKWCLIQAKMKQMYSNLWIYCEIKQAVVLFDYFIFVLFDYIIFRTCWGLYNDMQWLKSHCFKMLLGGPRVGVEAPLAPGPASGVFLAESQQFPDCQSFETFFELRGCVVTALLNG